jgi:hypothetical protein
MTRITPDPDTAPQTARRNKKMTRGPHFAKLIAGK